MARKASLNCQSTKVCIVIRKNKEIPISLIQEYCEEYFERYAFIKHERDIEPTSGEVIPVHYHIVGDFNDTRVRFSTRLNDIVKFFKFKDNHGIEIDQYRTFEGSLQYLTHKNQVEKTPHKKEEIIHNLSKDDFELFYSADVGNVITFDLIYSLCLSCNNIIEVIKAIGIANYRSYRAVIWDIWNCIRFDRNNNTNRPSDSDIN